MTPFIGARAAILTLCILAGGLFGDSADVVGEAADATGKPISVKIVDCDAAELQDDAALFQYLLAHGFSSASTGEPLVDFSSQHTRVYRYPGCVVYIRAELTSASTMIAKSRPRVRSADEFTAGAEYVSEYGLRFANKNEYIHLATQLSEMSNAFIAKVNSKRTAEKRSQVAAAAAEPTVDVSIKFDVKVAALGKLDHRLVHDLTSQTRASKHNAGETKGPKLTAFTFADLPWYLDRITGSVGFDDAYTVHPVYETPTQPHWVYHIGTGVMRSHIEFTAPGGNESIVRPDIFDVYPAQVNNRNSHETFTAALIAGQRFGRGPRNVVIFPATVLDANGEGWLSDVAAALHAVYYHLQQHHRDGIPVSINLSLGGPASAAFQHELEGILTRLRNEFDAVSFVSAGNDAVDACSITPAVLSTTVRGVVTVAASTIGDTWAGFSNRGSCVNVIMPGKDILSASNECAACYVQGSGTSFSAPLLHRLYILARSVNLTASYARRYPPAPVHRYYCQPVPENSGVAQWENGLCINGTVIYGACDLPEREVMVYDCANGTRSFSNESVLQCVDGTLVTRYTCENGSVAPADPEQDSWHQTEVPVAYLPSELTLDYLFRYNAQRGQIRNTPSQTPNLFISLRHDTFINDTQLPYGDMVTFSFIGIDKPGQNNMKIEVRPYTTLGSIQPTTLPQAGSGSTTSSTSAGTGVSAGPWGAILVVLLYSLYCIL